MSWLTHKLLSSAWQLENRLLYCSHNRFAKRQAITMDWRLNCIKLVAVVGWMTDKNSFDHEWTTVWVTGVALGVLHCAPD